MVIALNRNNFVLSLQNVTFKKCAAEDYPEISLKFNVTAVPTILLFKNGTKIDQLTGADPVALNEKLQQFVSILRKEPVSQLCNFDFNVGTSKLNFVIILD